VTTQKEQLGILREAGVVDAGGAGLLELVRGLAAATGGASLAEAPAPRARASLRSSQERAIAGCSESLGAGRIIGAGQTMTPGAAELLEAVEALAADEALLLPNNPNVVMAAEQAARLAGKPVEVVPTTTVPAGLAALAAFHGERSAEANAAAMREALEPLVSGEVTVASRTSTVEGLAVRKGDYLGLFEGVAVAANPNLEGVVRALLERLLAEPRDVFTVLTGEGAPPLNGILADIARRHPDLELDVHEGGQPYSPLLFSAE
jgi:uncharacterized protein